MANDGLPKRDHLMTLDLFGTKIEDLSKLRRLSCLM